LTETDVFARHHHHRIRYSSVIRDQKGPGPKFGKQDARGNSAYVVPAKRKQGGEEPSAEERNKKPENDNRDKAREHEFKKQRQRELEIEREREREREKEKEREKARQRERERIDRERAAKGLPPSSPSSNLSRSATSIANLAEEGIYTEPRCSVPCARTYLHVCCGRRAMQLSVPLANAREFPRRPRWRACPTRLDSVSARSRCRTSARPPLPVRTHGCICAALTLKFYMRSLHHRLYITDTI
jgi:hypothetical protein